MKKPYITCHMIMSIDGKTIGDFLMWEDKFPIGEAYSSKISEYAPDAFIGGRTSMQSFGSEEPLELTGYENISVSREDFIADLETKYYAITIDSKGKTNWTSGYIPSEMGVYGNSHIITIVSESVSDAYLAFLQDKGVSYLICGKSEINLELAMEKLNKIFNIKTLLLLGGPTINGTFAKAKLVDELSVVVAPTTGYAKPTSSLFYTQEDINDGSDMSIYTFNKIEQLENNIIWLNYKNNK